MPSKPRRWLNQLKELTREPQDTYPQLSALSWVRRSSRGNDELSPDATPDTASALKAHTLSIEFSRSDLKPKGWDRLVIHPDNRPKAYFESVIVACVLYTAILEPVKVAFSLEINPEVDTVLDSIFILDLGVQFIAGYHDAGGKRFPVLVLRRVFNNYLRTWFFIDLVAAIPFDRCAHPPYGCSMQAFLAPVPCHMLTPSHIRILYSSSLQRRCRS